MAVDETIGSLTGERLTERIRRGFNSEKTKEIERRLRKGERVIPLGMQF
ncbi:hypothetical protein [Synechococcus sp. KORDI-100]|nr:hypothetical protein [Synechococcus sp. KORDI-100]